MASGDITKDAELGKHSIVVCRAAYCGMTLEMRPLLPMPDPLRQIVEEMK